MQEIDFTFVDEQGSDLNKFSMQDEQGAIKEVKLVRSANITRQGTPLNAENMNKLVAGINNRVIKNLVNISNQNLNNIIDKGNGFFVGNNMTNAPDNQYYYIQQQIYTNEYALQFATQVNNNVENQYIYYRNKIGNKWSNWQRLDNNDINDEITFVDTNCSLEYEITGQGHTSGYDIQDSQMKVSKIQGRTERASYNLCKINNRSVSLTAGNNKWFGANVTNSDYFGKLVNGQTYTIIAYGEVSGVAFQFIPGYKNIKNTTWTFTYDSSVETLVRFGSDSLANATTFTINVLLVEGSYETDTIPQYIPYNDKLLSSNANIVSTGRNLFNKDNVEIGYLRLDSPIGTLVPSNDFRTSEWLLVEPNTTYYYNGYTGNVGKKVVFYYDRDKNYLSSDLANISSAKSFTTPSNVYYMRVVISATQLDTFTLSVGNTPLNPYEPYKQETMNIGVELNAYDYWENGKLVNQSSNIIKVDGTKIIATSKSETPHNNLYFFNYSADLTIADNNVVTNDVICNRSEFIGRSVNYMWSNSSFGIAFYAETSALSIGFTTSSDYDTIDKVNAFLQTNPLYIVYKTKTITTQDLPLDNFIDVWRYGTQRQIVDNSLPYILDKEYPLSLKSQLLFNAENDTRQQEEINELQDKVEELQPRYNHYINLKSNDSRLDISICINSTYENSISMYDEFYELIATTISGEQMSEYYFHTCNGYYIRENEIAVAVIGIRVNDSRVFEIRTINEEIELTEFDNSSFEITDTLS